MKLSDVPDGAIFQFRGQVSYCIMVNQPKNIAQDLEYDQLSNDHVGHIPCRKVIIPAPWVSDYCDMDVIYFKS